MLSRCHHAQSHTCLAACWVQIELRRALQDAAQKLPALEVAVTLPAIKASLSDYEFQLITSVAGANIGEVSIATVKTRGLCAFCVAKPTRMHVCRCLWNGDVMWCVWVVGWGGEGGILLNFVSTPALLFLTMEASHLYCSLGQTTDKSRSSQF
jgi:hypothetical protein